MCVLVWHSLIYYSTVLLEKKKTMKVILTVVLDIFFCLKLNYYYAHHL